MNVKLTHGFILGRNLELLLLLYPGRVRSVSRKSQQYFSVYYSFSTLEPGSDLIQ